MWNKATRVKSSVESASNKHIGGILMVCVGIDVAKDKHDCFIISSEGEILADVFTIPNNAEGFDTLLQAIRRSTRPEDKIKVGLEATGSLQLQHPRISFLTKVYPPMSSIRCTPISTEKA